MMLKRHVFIYALLSALLLSACASAPSYELAGNNAQILIGPMAYFSQHELDDYYKYIQDHKSDLPRNFVTWDQIAALGDWRNFGFIPGSRDTGKYSYGIIDQTGLTVILHMDHSYTADETVRQTVCVFDEMTSMSRAPVKEKSVINRNGFKYMYNAGGNLVSIHWNQNGIHYFLSEKLEQYPVEETQSENASIIGRLLSTSDDVAYAAIEEIKQHLKAN